MAKLVLSSGGNILHQYFIEDEPLGIGRDPSNAIHLNHPMVSRRHARIIAVGEDHIIEDLGGSNGTQVNGVRVSRRILQHRDIIECLPYQLCYLNTRLAADVDLDRTMLIADLPGIVAGAAAAAPAEAAAIPVRRPLKVSFPNASVHRLSGPGAGTREAIDRVIATFGRAGEQVIVITRRPHGCFLSVVEGHAAVRINGSYIDAVPYPLCDGDEIEVAGTHLEFSVGPGDID